MKTIEEKARLNLQYEKDFLGRDLSEDMVYRAYIAGAKEQKAIDEEVRLKKSDNMTQAEYDREVAFADWYNKNGKGTPTYSDAIEWARKEVINKACEWICECCPAQLGNDNGLVGCGGKRDIDCPTIKSLIKAMEEN